MKSGSMEKAKDILTAEHFSVSFMQRKGLWGIQKLPVIQDLSLKVREGEMVAVVGASGSGKSILAHGIMGLLPENACVGGKLFFRGREITAKTLKELRGHRMVLVPQSVSYLDPLMRVGEQVRNGKKDIISRRRGRETLERYGLGEETERLYPFELSGGMTRRILISTAVMENAELVIADEPTPGLHLEAAKRVLSHFREIADAGAGVLLITHDLSLALETVDRIVVFYAGTAVEEAGAGDFSKEESLRHPYTKALYRAMPEHGFLTVSGSQPFVTELPRGCFYGPRCAYFSEECKGTIPYRGFQEGMVRCLKAGQFRANGEDVHETGRKKSDVSV